MKNAETAAAPACPHCSTTFAPRRKNQKYCGEPCAKAATRHTARGPRTIENAQRNERHYSRAAWLSYDLNRMSPVKQRAMLLAILEAASGGDGALRTILFDPNLLGADRFSPLGKLHPDTKCPGTLNIAKMVNAFCKMEWGCGVRDMILDNGKPAGRKFVEDGADAIIPPHIYERTQEGHLVGHEERNPVPVSTSAFFQWLSTQRAEHPLSQPRVIPVNPDRENDYDRVDRIVREAQERVSKLPPVEHPEVQTTVQPKVGREGYDWRRIAGAMGDKGWRRYYAPEELDLLM
jgi:hypothetical protein